MNKFLVISLVLMVQGLLATETPGLEASGQNVSNPFIQKWRSTAERYRTKGLADVSSRVYPHIVDSIDVLARVPEIKDRIKRRAFEIKDEIKKRLDAQRTDHANYTDTFNGNTLPDDWEEVERPNALEEEPVVIDSLLRSMHHEPSQQEVNEWRLLSQAERESQFGYLAVSSDTQTPQQTGGVGLKPPVRAVYRFLPENNNDRVKKRLVLFIHGTFSHHNAKFASDQTAAFKAVLNYAELSSRALPEHPVVEVMSWSWSGYNYHDSRKLGGENLALLLDNIRSNYSSIEIIAHSHGCNVVNIASHFISKATIDTAFYFACPVRPDNPLYQPATSMKSLYNFYSPVDKIQWAGSIDDTLGVKSTTFAASAIFGNKNWWGFNVPGIDIRNIECYVDNRAPGHSYILGELGGLYYAVRWIREKYAGCHNFIMHSTLEPSGETLETLVALAPDEQCSSPQAREYSEMALSLYKERSGRDMNTIDAWNRLTTIK